MSHPPIVELVIRNTVDATAALLDAGASPCASYPRRSSRQPLAGSSRSPGAGVPIDARDAEGRTVTHYVIGACVTREALSLLEWLVARGAPVDVPDANGELPLARALRASRSRSRSRCCERGSGDEAVGAQHAG